MSIDDLCTESDSRRPVNQRYTADTVDKYVADLQRVIDLVTAGSVRPSHAKLVQHFRETLNVFVTQDTIRRHLDSLRKDGFIWQR